VLVNGSAESAMGIRARGLFESSALNGWAVILYREQRGLAALFYFLRQVFYLRPGMIYVLNIGYAGVGCALFYRVFFRVPYMLDTGDLLYEMAALTRQGTCIYRQFLRLGEFVALKLAHKIVVRGSAHITLLKEQGCRNVRLVPDGVWPQHSRPMDTSDLRAGLGLEDKFVIGVMGSCHWIPALDWAYGLDLVEVLARLKKYPVCGIMIGDGDGLEVVKNRAIQAGVAERVLFLGRVAYDQLPLWINLFDFALSTQNNTLAARVRTTGKLPEYLACGRYVIASAVGEARNHLPPDMLVEYIGSRDYTYAGRVAGRIARVLARQPRPPLHYAAGVAIARRNFDYELLGRRLKKIIME
jgi:glycosyltransferase involved in cell wall biosynthesis